MKYSEYLEDYNKEDLEILEDKEDYLNELKDKINILINNDYAEVIKSIEKYKTKTLNYDSNNIEDKEYCLNGIETEDYDYPISDNLKQLIERLQNDDLEKNEEFIKEVNTYIDYVKEDIAKKIINKLDIDIEEINDFREYIKDTMDNYYNDFYKENEDIINKNNDLEL